MLHSSQMADLSSVGSHFSHSPFKAYAMISAPFKVHLETILHEYIWQITPLGGGDINQTAVLYTKSQPYFIKWNNTLQYPAMLAKEAKGLNLLKKYTDFYIPRVISEGSFSNVQFLMLEMIDSSVTIDSVFWRSFGIKLAGMHQQTNAYFGLDYDNFIGSLAQKNAPLYDGISFFVNQRLQPQVELTMKHRLLTVREKKQFDQLYVQLKSLLPDEKPALLHGDLWSGNYMINKRGEATLIDPAVHYGLREAELSFMRLFGGFGNTLFDTYEECFPVAKGFEERIALYNLYPLLVHLNLFGSSYFGSIKSTLNRFISG